MEKFDVFVFGSGSAGQGVAKECAKHGLKVAIIDKREYGGVCSLRGCDPKKLVLAPVQAYHAAQNLKSKGLKGSIEIDWREALQHAREYTNGKPRATREDLKEAGITCLEGQAKFVGPHTVDLDGKHIQADHFVIATGMKTMQLDIPGEEHMVDYEQFFELENPPKEILFVGAGYISMEFGNMLSRAGSKITIIEKGPHILSPFEPYCADKIEEAAANAGINIVKQADVKEVVKNGADDYTVIYKKDGAEFKVESNLVFNCSGRVPQIDQLGLDKINLETADAGIKVNNRLQSVTHSHIYACGDVSSKHIPLTPLSSREAVTVAKNLKGEPATIDIDIIPSAAFTFPECASVGMTEHDALDQNKSIEVIEKDASGFYNLKRVNGECYAFKLIVEKGTENLLGAHIVGPDAAEQINLFALAMKAGMTMTQFEDNIFTYPSWGNDLLSLR
ncbi:MAG: NAD(P)/FAD-dependent oxidoreductase [Nonlabens sp.]